jgi:D-alanyl-lipoteichoic acid acyltransferase DltB (MBOAT superfamily)
MGGDERGPGRLRFPVLLAGVGLVFIELILLALTMRHMDVADSALRRVLFIAAPAVVINHFLPRRFRLRFFLGLSLVCLVILLGRTPDNVLEPWLGLKRTVIALAIGSLLIGICHLHLGFWIRAGLLLAAGGVIAVFRAGLMADPVSIVVWPVLAIFFMFRLIIYLYDVSTSKMAFSLTQSLTYFYLIPAVCTPLFPVIDFKTFVRSHASSVLSELEPKGIRWMLRGFLQLICFRIVGQLFMLKPELVSNGAALIQYVLSNSLIYLKVSGLFHLSIGLLLLFGFDLPETNHRYFLASSITDYWRRVNIYWKDFVMKIFYFPSYFKVKKYGTVMALVVATLFTFFMTWVLHLYQKLWLIGSASVTWTDVLFWSLLGLLVLVNALWEMKGGRPRKLPTNGYDLRAAMHLALRTAAVFACISFLWSLWSASSISAWRNMWIYADWTTLAGAGAALAVVMIAKILWEVLPRRAESKVLASGTKIFKSANYATHFACLGTCVLFLLAAPRAGAPKSGLILNNSSWLSLNYALAAGDSAAPAVGEFFRQGGGYYEDLTNVNAGNLSLLKTLRGGRFKEMVMGANPIRDVRDLRLREFLPSIHLQAYSSDFETNRWGMRDRDYSLEKPGQTVRIALLGSSQVQGWGVPPSKLFKVLVENRLNHEFGGASSGHRFEILNFAVYGYNPLSQVILLNERVRLFSPDMVLLVVHLIDFKRLAHDLIIGLRQGIPIPQHLKEILNKAKVRALMHTQVAEDLLIPYQEELMEWSFRELVQKCNFMGALPVCVYIPSAVEIFSNADQHRAPLMIDLARAAGFITLDLSHVYDNQNPKDLILENAFWHDAELAHALSANALFHQLTEDPRIQKVLINPLER